MKIPTCHFFGLLMIFHVAIGRSTQTSTRMLLSECRLTHPLSHPSHGN